MDFDRVVVGALVAFHTSFGLVGKCCDIEHAGAIVTQLVIKTAFLFG